MSRIERWPLNFFDQAKRNGYDLKYYAEKIAKLVRYNPNILNSIMNLLFRLSDANDGPSKKAGRIFR